MKKRNPVRQVRCECGSVFAAQAGEDMCPTCWVLATAPIQAPPTGDSEPSGAPRVSRIGTVKDTAGKPDWSLLPGDCLEALVRVYEAGAEKYWRDSWREGIAYSQLWAAVQRHLWAFHRGENLNPGPGPETGLEHLAQAAWGCLSLLWMTWNRPDLDDRWQPRQPHDLTERQPL